MQSHYEINVSKNGKHLFATSERSLVTEAEAVRVLAEISKRFPESEGFQISTTYWNVVGQTVNFKGATA